MAKSDTVLLGVEAMQALLRKSVAREGSQAAWAQKFGVHPDYVSHVLTGLRLPTRSVLAILELRKVAAYESTRPTGEPIWSHLTLDARVSIAPDYHFALHDAEGAMSDNLGDLQLADDNAAIDHARLVVHDMLIDNPAHYPHWTMNITQDERVVRTLPVE